VGDRRGAGWDAFDVYIKQVLVPTLEAGDVVVMDNLSVHKVGWMKSALEACGAELQYLPPYSPDLNPIEIMLVEGEGGLAEGQGADGGRVNGGVERGVVEYQRV
jgi:hypothetical protein